MLMNDDRCGERADQPVSSTRDHAAPPLAGDSAITTCRPHLVVHKAAACILVLLAWCFMAMLRQMHVSMRNWLPPTD